MTRVEHEQEPALTPECVTLHRVRVRFAETDLMAIAHHATYLVYFEEARVEYLRRRKIRYSDWVARGFHVPVVESRVRHHRTARFDDVLVVECRMVAQSRVTVRFAYRVELEGDPGKLVASGHTLLACVGDDHRPRRFPEEVTEALRHAETTDL